MHLITMIPVPSIRHILWYFVFIIIILSMWLPVVILPCHVICHDSHHIFVHHFILCCFYLTNSRLWYKGTLKNLRESFTGSEIWIWNWQDVSCVVDIVVRYDQWGCQQVCRQVSVTLLCMCKVFPTRKGEQMIMISVSLCSHRGLGV